MLVLVFAAIEIFKIVLNNKIAIGKIITNWGTFSAESQKIYLFLGHVRAFTSRVSFGKVDQCPQNGKFMTALIHKSGRPGEGGRVSCQCLFTRLGREIGISTYLRKYKEVGILSAYT